MHTKENGSIFVPHGVVSRASVILLFNWPFQITPRRSTNTIWRVFTAEFVMTRSVACITTSCYKKTERYSFIGVCSKTTSVNWQQKGSPFSILIKQEMMGLQWRQLDHMQNICTSRQTTTPTPYCQFLQARCSSSLWTSSVKAVTSSTESLRLPPVLVRTSVDKIPPFLQWLATLFAPLHVTERSLA